VVELISVLLIRDQGSGAFSTPGSGSGIRNDGKISYHISVSFVMNVFILSVPWYRLSRYRNSRRLERKYWTRT
jgi:hypothetical protein